MALISVPSRGLTSRINPPDQNLSRDIVQEAFDEAINLLKQEFADDPKSLDWVGSLTSIEQAKQLLLEAECQYKSSTNEKKNLQRWLRSASSRLLYYGNVLDVLAQQHPEYVSLVWGGVKFVLMGIMNHAQLVAEFSRALAEIGDILPQTTLNAKLYANDHMRDAVAHLYVHLLQFVRLAIKWYRRGPAGRAISAIFKPFELSYKGTIDEIQRCANIIQNIAAGRARMEIRDMHVLLQLQGQRLTDIEKNLGKISDSVLANMRVAIENKRLSEEIRLGVNDMRPRIIDMQFGHIMGILQPRRMPQDALKRHQSIMKRRHPFVHNSTSMGSFSSCLDSWMSSPQPSLLVLQAGPRAERNAKDLVTHLITLLQSSSQNVAWYLSGLDSSSNGVFADEVFKSLIFQLIRTNPATCSHLVGGYLQTMKLHGEHAACDWAEILWEVAKLFQPCYLIIEAEDLARSLKGNANHTREFTQLFQGLVDRSCREGLNLKILLVAYGFPEAREENTPSSSRSVLLVRPPVILPPHKRRRCVGKLSHSIRFRFQ
ncbi:hypothetical protein F5Y10DRAFT_74044 [Nemania abortiva]|nr:hypothetical protein F5Y10DRAFT_74044 [Nemania abortiva]